MRYDAFTRYAITISIYPADGNHSMTITKDELQDAITALETTRKTILDDCRLGPAVKDEIAGQAVMYAAFLSDIDNGQIDIDASAREAFDAITGFSNNIMAELSAMETN